MSADKRKITKWLGWAKIILEDLVHLLGSRKIFKSYLRLVNAHPLIAQRGGLFHDWAIRNYATFVAMSIRRQADRDSDVVSLVRLISEIEESPETLTREWHASLYKHMPELANGTFTRHAGPGEHFDPQIATGDLKKLVQLSTRIKRFADREIAHRSRRPRVMVTHGQVDECIDAMKEIAQRYILLLTASWNILEPQMDYWEFIFECWNSKEREED